MIDNNYLKNTTHNIAWIYKRYLAEELQLKPPFQRNPVWTDNQKSYLIDTILNGFPVPELYMQEYSDKDGNDVYVVVDGQQRVRSCIEFIQGKFSMSGIDSPKWADMSFDQLSDDEKKSIYNYTFVVRLLPEIPDDEIRGIFKRLNRYVVALNKQELRHATYWGQFIRCVEEIADEERWSSFGIFTPNDVRRMLDIEFISELVVGYLHGPQNKKESLDRWYQAYEVEFPDDRRVRKIVNATLGEVESCLPLITKTRWRKKSDFYSLFLALAAKSQSFPLAKDQRVKLTARLTEFGEWVDAYIRDPEAAKVPKEARVYAEAVEKAASDLARRKERHLEITKILDDIVK